MLFVVPKSVPILQYGAQISSEVLDGHNARECIQLSRVATPRVNTGASSWTCSKMALIRLSGRAQVQHRSVLSGLDC